MNDDAYIPPEQAKKIDERRKNEHWYPTSLNLWNIILIILLIIGIISYFLERNFFWGIYAIAGFFFANDNYYYAIRNGYNKNWAFGITLCFGLIGYFLYRYFRKENK